MNHEIKKIQKDILKSIEIIDLYLQPITSLSDYKNNLLVIDAVERRLAIISDALWKADKSNSSIFISNKMKIIALRPILIHDYDLIDNDTIWAICKKTFASFKNGNSINFKPGLTIQSLQTFLTYDF